MDYTEATSGIDPETFGRLVVHGIESSDSAIETKTLRRLARQLFDALPQEDRASPRVSVTLAKCAQAVDQSTPEGKLVHIYLTAAQRTLESGAKQTPLTVIESANPKPQGVNLKAA